MKRKGVTTSRPLDFEIWYFPINFLVEKCLFVSYKLVKVNFTTVDPLLEKCVWSPPGKIQYCPPWKNLSDAHAPLYVNQSFSNFSHVSIYPSNASFHDTSSMLAGVIINCTNKKMFFNFQLTKSFWYRSRKLLDVEDRSRAKTLDVWSRSQSPSLNLSSESAIAV